LVFLDRAGVAGGQQKSRRGDDPRACDVSEQLPTATDMQTLLRAIFYAVGAVFGVCAGAVIGMVACLVLRDGLQWEMPLSRIAIIAGCFAVVGLLVSVLYERRSLRSNNRIV
jgi:ABC-type cobalamin transport system permease subunit